MSARICTSSLILATGSLVIAYGIGDLWGWAIVLACSGILGAFSPKSLGDRLGRVWFIVFVAAAAIGVIIGLPVVPLLVAVLASLAYWDLDGLKQRLSKADSTDMTRSLEKNHLRRLLIVLGLGLVASLIGLSIHIDLSMIWAILLGLVIVISLRLGIRALQTQNKTSPE